VLQLLLLLDLVLLVSELATLSLTLSLIEFDKSRKFILPGSKYLYFNL